MLCMIWNHAKTCSARLQPSVCRLAMPIRKPLPSLNALLVLEVAVRHRSFTRAAVELGVTQAAISRQIAQLEQELDTPLFERRHRAVLPTPAGQMLASTLALSFSNIAETVAQVRGTEPAAAVTIGATLAFSTFWLLPRIGEFRKRYPAAQIRVVSQDSRMNLAAAEVDVLVRYGVPPFDDGVVVASRGDEVIAVAAPELAERLRHEGFDPADPGIELIEQAATERSWYAWADWLSLAGRPGLRVSPSLTFSHYTDVVQATLSGHGVALGWRLMLQRHLAEGTLVPISQDVVAADGRYNVLLPLRRQTHPLRDLFVEWLAAELSR
jgi:DNA-binding transcriptional LysR family regulator